MASFLASQSFHLNKVWQLRRTCILLTSYILLLTSCTSSKKITAQEQPNLLADSNLLNAHVGISIYDPAENQYIYTHQADKYFIPASNTKLYTCYAAMKHLGDSLVGLRYTILAGDNSTTPILWIQPSADPTLLHADFKNHPVFNFLSQKKSWRFAKFEGSWQIQNLGDGWAWNDYLEPYMAERSSFPIYGNTIKLKLLPPNQRIGLTEGSKYHGVLKATPSLFDSAVNADFLNHAYYLLRSDITYEINRELGTNVFNIRTPFGLEGKTSEITFSTKYDTLIFNLLADTLKSKVILGTIHKIYSQVDTPSQWGIIFPDTVYKYKKLENTEFKTIHSQPTDSVLKPMMHRSDNFFAEQTLLMVSNEMLGVMNDEKIIDSLLKTDFKDLPQKPRWVDGSGLSRYNLFSPNDMVFVLNKMKNEFSWNRITTILATGGEGTLSNYYLNLKDRIFAKTGTISNNICLSGFLITKQNKTLIFSVMVNNHMGSATQIRKAVEKFLTYYSESY